MTSRISSFLRRGLDAYMAARQREAEVYVSRVLLSFDDRTLQAQGYERSKLEKAARLNV